MTRETAWNYCAIMVFCVKEEFIKNKAREQRAHSAQSRTKHQFFTSHSTINTESNNISALTVITSSCSSHSISKMHSFSPKTASLLLALCLTSRADAFIGTLVCNLSGKCHPTTAPTLNPATEIPTQSMTTTIPTATPTTASPTSTQTSNPTTAILTTTIPSSSSTSAVRQPLRHLTRQPQLRSLQFQARLQLLQVRRPLQLLRSLRFQPRLQQLQFKFQLLQVRRPLRPLRSLRFQP